MKYVEILMKLREFEKQRFRNENDLRDLLATMTYDALTEVLTKLAEEE